MKLLQASVDNKGPKFTYKWPQRLKQTSAGVLNHFLKPKFQLTDKDFLNNQSPALAGLQIKTPLKIKMILIKNAI